jgi:hypothetical protein
MKLERQVFFCRGRVSENFNLAGVNCNFIEVLSNLDGLTRKMKHDLGRSRAIVVNIDIRLRALATVGALKFLLVSLSLIILSRVTLISLALWLNRLLKRTEKIP